MGVAVLGINFYICAPSLNENLAEREGKIVIYINNKVYNHGKRKE